LIIFQSFHEHHINIDNFLQIIWLFFTVEAETIENHQPDSNLFFLM